MLHSLITRYWLLLPLLVLAVVLIDRAETPDPVETEETIDMRATRSDYYLSEFRTRKFGADGNIEYQLDGKTLAHYPADDHSQISEPRVELNRKDIRWTMTSDSGRFDPAPNLFTLTGDVNIQRLNLAAKDNADTGVVTMTTQKLLIAPEDNLVETDELVEITAPTWQLRSKGLRSSINDGQLQLLSDVIGQYQLPAPLDKQ